MKAHAQAVKAPPSFLHVDFHANPALWKGLLAILFGAIVP